MLPEEHIVGVMEGKHVPAVDVKQATIDCMRHPIGSAPLQEKVQKGDKVCLVVADVTALGTIPISFSSISSTN